MNPILITMLLIISFSGFFYFSRQKFRVIFQLTPERRAGNVFKSLTKVIKMGFFQSRMVKGDFKAGLMHVIIFWGFSALLIRKIQLFIIGYVPDFTYPGLLGGVYATFKDGVEVAVIVAVCYSFYRRFILKPARFEPNKEAIFILSLIMTIMVTDFLYDGFKFALLSEGHEGLTHEREYAFVGHQIALLLSGLPESALTIGYHGFYWIQMVTVLGFLVLLPLGEHFHIVTALPALFFGVDSPLNKVPKVDLEALMDEDDDNAEEMVVGIATAKDLSWKDGLDVFTCTECGRCKTSCPTWITGKPLSLKWVNDSLKHHLMEKRDFIHLAVEGDEEALPPLVGEVISEDTLWACTTCGFCESACPIELEHLSKFYKMRQYKVMMDGEFPTELQAAFDNYERQSNPWGLNSATRGDWAEGLDVPTLDNEAQSSTLDYLFYVGSAQSFDTRNQKVAKAFVKILNQAKVKFAILGAEEGSTGETVRRAGNEMLFQELCQQLVETLNGYGVKRIVTCDPHAFNALKNEYPEFGGNFEVIHHTQLIEQFLESGRIQVSSEFEKVIYHEPCYLGRHNREYEAPRKILTKLTKDSPIEFDMNREKSMCCGAGGGRMWMEETIGKRINVTRVEQALDKDPKIIATACPYCTIMMTDGVAHHEKDEEIQTKDIAELVAEALVVSV